MKSQLLKLSSILSSEFYKHLESISQLDSKVLSDVPNIVLEYELADTREAEISALEKLGKFKTLKPEQIEILTKITRFFFQKLQPEDEYDDITEDLSKMLDFDETQFQNLCVFIKTVMNAYKQEYRLRKLISSARAGVIPVLRNISYYVDLRAVNEAILKSDNNIDKYLPKIFSVVPVGVVRLSFDEGNPVILQLSPRGVDSLKVSLDALKKDISYISVNFDSLKLEI